jgi:hypothetical protein
MSLLLSLHLGVSVLNHISPPKPNRIVASPLSFEFLDAVRNKPFGFRPAGNTLGGNDAFPKTAETRPVKLGWLPLSSSGRSSSQAPESSELRVQLPNFGQLSSMAKEKDIPQAAFRTARLWFRAGAGMADPRTVNAKRSNVECCILR